jgi:DNA-directed RNA polymerase subunit RPC12/RpoP
MVKYYCDICGTELPSITSRYSIDCKNCESYVRINPYGPDKTYIELCSGCVAKIQNFLREEYLKRYDCIESNL